MNSIDWSNIGDFLHLVIIIQILRLISSRCFKINVGERLHPKGMKTINSLYSSNPKDGDLDILLILLFIHRELSFGNTSSLQTVYQQCFGIPFFDMAPSFRHGVSHHNHDICRFVRVIQSSLAYLLSIGYFSFSMCGEGRILSLWMGLWKPIQKLPQIIH